MNRRSLLRGLLALPFVPLLAKAAKAAPESVSEWFLKWPERHQAFEWWEGQPTLYGLMKRQDQNGSMLPIVEALSQRNHLLQDMVWKGPAPIGHKITMGGKFPPRHNWLKRSINGD